MDREKYQPKLTDGRNPELINDTQISLRVNSAVIEQVKWLARYQSLKNDDEISYMDIIRERINDASPARPTNFGFLIKLPVTGARDINGKWFLDFKKEFEWAFARSALSGNPKFIGWIGPIMFKGEEVGDLCYGMSFTFGRTSNLRDMIKPVFTMAALLGEKLAPADSRELERTIMLSTAPNLIAMYDGDKFLHMELFEGHVIFEDRPEDSN
jgi:hypothetical protein